MAPGGRRGPLTVEQVVAEALAVLDEHGVAGLNARDLTRRLSCSTKTIYGLVGNRHAMVRRVVAAAFTAMDLQLGPTEDWQGAVRQWCRTLHAGLLAHPWLGELMTPEDREATVAYVVRLVDALEAYGLPRRRAVAVAGNVGHFTIATTLLDLRAPGQWDHPERFEETLGWLVRGLEDEMGAPGRP